jgi:hypothetical protein
MAEPTLRELRNAAVMWGFVILIITAAALVIMAWPVQSL